jgi:hypothetical protein
MIDRLTEIARRYGMEMNMEKKTKVMRISRQLYPIKIMIDQNQLENGEYFNYLGSIITNDARCTREINPELLWQKQHLTRRRIFSPSNWT